MPSLEDALKDLHDIVYLQGKRTSTARLNTLAQYVVEEFEQHGISDWETEVTLDAFARDKTWDVVHKPGKRPRIAISLKSILFNLGGAIPNRTDDLIGETTDLQMRYPEIIIGYLVIVDTVNTDDEPRRSQWAGVLAKRLESISGREAPFWDRGTIEASLVVKACLEGKNEPDLVTSQDDIERFFSEICDEYEQRFL